jgi:hypothetical protein
MSMVIVVREDAAPRTYIGFLLDNEILECSECTQAAAYRIRYTADEQNNLPEHRFAAHRIIESEHPNHSENIRVL